MLTRRRFSGYVVAGAGLSSLGAPPSAAQGVGTDYDVIVIGAGVSGLVAARRLSTAPIDPKVLVLEARDRLGGRVLSRDLAGEPRDAELGALHLPRTGDGAGVSAEGWAPVTELDLATESLPSGHTTLFPSMGTLVRAIAEQSVGKVQLNSPVTGVIWREGLVGVTYENLGLESSVTARRIILTVPPSVLRLGGISIAPALPAAKVRAIESISGTPAISAAVLFKGGTASLTTPEAVWCREETFVSYRAFAMAERTDLLLEAQFRGPRAEALAGQDEDLIAGLALGGFAEVLDRVPLLAAAAWKEVKDWSTEPFSAGARMRIPDPAVRRTLAESVSDTLFFAGDATAVSDADGGLADAYASGERVAREVALSLGPGDASAEEGEAPILEPL